MKPDLKRIETTLHQLAERSPVNGDTAPLSWGNQPGSLKEQPRISQKERLPSLVKEQLIPVPKHQGRTPMLPKVKPPSFSNHRHAANPALAMNLLQEIQVIVADWQSELQQVLRQIQDIYLEGPIVDGWLESYGREPEAGVRTLDKAVVNQVMDYMGVYSKPDTHFTYQSPSSGYRLCGLDADGKLWSRPCPPQQVASVSVAIARYHKLRQLLNRKQDLETRLSQLAETLVVLHSHLAE
ncbi:MAG TPA: hypothetical protein V6D12_07310 [Candidatus Obscuribacterales bacterium]